MAGYALNAMKEISHDEGKGVLSFLRKKTVSPINPARAQDDPKGTGLRDEQLNTLFEKGRRVWWQRRWKLVRNRVCLSTGHDR